MDAAELFSIRGKTKARRAQSSTRASVIEARGYRHPRKFRAQDWTWANVEDEWLARNTRGGG